MDNVENEMARPDWAPPGLDLNRPSAARIYDYLLGGFHNFEIDRKYADQAIKAYPGTVESARVSRGFLRRAIRFLSERGIEQFLDIGSGIPTVGHVHEIARRPGSCPRTVYVDIDPIAVAHSTAILKGSEDARVVVADARQHENVLAQAAAGGMLDLSRPMALLFVAVLHLVSDDQEATDLITSYREALAPGSYIVISHPTFDGAPAEVKERFEAIGKQASIASKHRSREEILPLLDELELVEPGLVFAPQWRPETDHDLMWDNPEGSLSLAAVGRK